MKRLESNFINMVVSTTLVALLAAGILGYVYGITKDPIAATKKQKQEQAIKDVLPEGAVLNAEMIQEIDGCTINPAFDAEGNFVGAAVESNDPLGFGGNVKVMTGFDPEGNIINYSVLEQAETPGLGVKMLEWFKKGNKGDIIGKNPETNNLTVSKDGGEVDAITAATISSRAFLRAVNAAFAAYKQANLAGAPAEVVAEETEATNDSINALDIVEEVVEEVAEAAKTVTLNNPVPNK